MGAPSHYKICAYRKLTTPKSELNALAKTSNSEEESGARDSGGGNKAIDSSRRKNLA